jgi:hypothetical protein
VTARQELLEAAEARLFDALGLDDDVFDAPGVFVLGSPRTGSTLLYQLVAAVFGLPYLSNFVDRLHPTTPALGLVSQAGAVEPGTLSFESAYGKTSGLFEPSEASALMRHWFGGEHPTQTRSARFLDGRREHCARTLATVRAVLGRPLVVKNPWNCFRIPELATTFPHARFVWIRRDIVAAARSDLAARYDYLGDPWAWSSASPANVDEIRERHYAEQVLEAQYEYNRTIGEDLSAHAPGRFVEVWYERLCKDPSATLRELEPLLGDGDPEPAADLSLTASDGPADLPPDDVARMDAHFAEHRERLLPFRTPSYSWRVG